MTTAGNSAGQQGARLGADEWPEGCVGYAFNLVRPALKGHRASLLYPMLGQTLVSLGSYSLLLWNSQVQIRRFFGSV